MGELRTFAFVGCFLALSVWTGCTSEIEGPTPAVSEVEPPVVCAEQVSTQVTLTGEKLSPLPVGTLENPQGVLPEIALTRSLDIGGQTATGEAVIIPDDPNDPDSSHVRWHSQESLSFDVFPELALETGLYGITATNANGNAAQLADSLLAVPPPTLAAIDPEILCSEQHNTLTLTGDFFIRWRGAEPSVALLDDSGLVAQLPVTTMSDCHTLPGTSGAEACETLTVDVPADTLSTGGALFANFDVIVHNPDSVPCSSTESVVLTVVPSPTLTAIEPDLVCLEQGQRQVRIVGTGFLEIDAVTPTLFLGIEPFTTTVDATTCTEITGPANTTAASCTALTAIIGEDALAAGGYDVVVQNPAPADCSTTQAVRFRVEPRPSVTSVVPDLVCNAEGSRTLTVSGAGLIAVRGATVLLPTVTIDGETYDADTATGCTTIPDTTLNAQSCDTLTVTVPQDDIGPGAHDVTVTNPQPAGCLSEETITLAIVPEPTVTGAQPDLFCTEDAGRSITITGTGFVHVTGGTPALPTVYLGTTPLLATSVGGTCATIAGTLLVAEACTELIVTVPPGTVPTGEHVVSVENPAPAGCTSNETDVLLFLVEAPVVASIEPPTYCSSSPPSELTVSGTGFLRVDAGSGLVDPFVTVDGNATGITLTGCTTWNGTDFDGETCTGFTFAVPGGGFADGSHTVLVTNPSPADCTSSIIFSVAPPPTLTNVQPSDVCDADDVTLTLTGANLTHNTVVSVGTVEATSVSGTTCEANGLCTELLAHFPADSLDVGTYDVTVSNGGGCETTMANAFTVNPTPLVFFVDPPVIYNGINTDVTIFTTGLSADALSVQLIDESGTVIVLSNFASPRPNRIVATIPDDDPNNPGSPLAPGTYAVAVTSNFGCDSELNGTLTITDTLTLAVESIDPTFASPTEPTAVTIIATDPAPTGEVQFESTPRVYLNPTAAGQVATAIRSVEYIDATTLTAIIPGGVTPGDYDLIVVNPGGAVGLLSPAVTVTVNEPPIIHNVSPSSLDAQSVTPVAAKIYGSAFDSADAANITVELECRDFTSGAAVASGTVTVDTGTASDTELDVDVDSSSIPIGAVCLVILTNPDTAFFRYSAISFKNATAAAATLSPWVTSAATMNEARRGLALEAARPTFRSRFLYAVGGDDGTAANTKTSVESINVDAFGQLDVVNGWDYQRNDLSNASVGGAVTSSPRAFAGVAQIGRFIYLAGGTDGTNPIDTVLRAEVLDPLAGPEILDVDATLGDGTIGLSEGLWYYKVSALFPSTDASNPGGESLPGEVLNVQLPQVAEKIVLTLTWQQITGASGYRLYRRDPDSSTLELLAEVTGVASTSYQDQGGTTDSNVTPMLSGSTGVWHSVAALGTVREAPATVAVPDPANGNTWYLYTVGGRDGSGPLDTGEYSTVTIAADGSQTVSAWTPLTATLSVAVSELSGFVVTPRDTTVVADSSGTDTFVYFGCGYNGTAATGALNVAEIGADGQIAAFASPGAGPTPGRAGAVSFAAGGFLYILGGANRQASSGNDVSKDIINASGGISGGAWDSLGGGALPEARIFAGDVQESAFFFVAGGATTGTNGAVTNAVVLTVQ